MSHGKLLLERMTAHVESGRYRAQGSPRAQEKPGATETPAPKAEPEKRPEPAKAERRDGDPASFVQGLSRRRTDAVGESVHSALDAKFKGGKK